MFEFFVRVQLGGMVTTEPSHCDRCASARDGDAKGNRACGRANANATEFRGSGEEKERSPDK